MNRSLQRVICMVAVAGAWSVLGGCAGPGASGVATASSAAAQRAALYSGGPILTMVGDAPNTVEAVAVRDGRIVFAGSKAQALASLPVGAAQIDLAGRTLLPGFIDGHGHIDGVGLQAVSANLLPPPDGRNDSIPALEQTMRDWMAGSPLPKDYNLALGFGYDDSQLKEQRHPTREDLDRVSSSIPVLFIHQSGHIGVANSRALEAAGITAATADPPGGVIRRRAGSREPDGVLEETAWFAVAGKLVFGQTKEKESQALITAGQELYLRYGYTTAQSGATDPSNVAGLMAAARAGRLKLDVVSYPMLVQVGDATFMQSEFASSRYTGRFRIGGVKITLDGSPQGKTAFLTQPYFKVPEGQKPDYRGYPAFTDQQIDGFLNTAYRKGWQVLGHTNGDAALDQLIGSVQRVSAQMPGADRRTVAIHAQTARADQLDAMKRLAIFPSFFPMHTFYWGDWHRDSVLGVERAQHISPTGWALERGMMFTSHHDAPVAFPDSVRVLASTVNRTTRSNQVLGPQHRVTPWVALKAMTTWAAYQHFEEQDKGTIEAGKRADFVVLDRNPITVDRAQLADLQVLETIKDGQTVYRKDVSKQAEACSASASCFTQLSAVVSTPRFQWLTRQPVQRVP
jgi:predicted amidohydrolase YtcJ